VRSGSQHVSASGWVSASSWGTEKLQFTEFLRFFGHEKANECTRAALMVGVDETSLKRAILAFFQGLKL